MRVLHILNELKASGAEVMLRVAGPFWRRQGIIGEILCTGETRGVYATSLQEAGFQVHHVPFTRSILFPLKVYKFFRAHKYDRIHIHTERANFWYAAAGYISGHRRMIRTVHSVFPFVGPVRILRCFQRQIMGRFFRVKTIAISPSVRECETKTCCNPTVLIRNWFDSDRHKPSTNEEREAARAFLGLEPKSMVAISVGNCSGLKNHTAILHAISQLPRSLNLTYLHVGQEQDGGDERQLAAELGISDRVRFFGSVLDISPILRAADVFLMPSAHEGFGVAACEAMGAGLPVILSDVPGLRDMRAFGPIQWIEPTVSGVSEALLYFCHMSEAQRNAIGRQLSESVHCYLGLGAGAARYAAIYLDNGAPSSPSIEVEEQLPGWSGY